MSQARRQRKLNTATQKLIGHGLREIVLIFFCFMGLYLFVSLLTYYPLDPGWSHSGQVEEVRNKGGVAGALFADIFFYLFGYFAYLFPIMVGYMGWMIYKGRHHDILAEPKNLVVPGIGFILTLSAGCGLAIVHFASEAVLLPSHAGGILGMVVGKSLQGVFSQLGATLLLLALFFTGVTLLTGLSWLKLMDTLGFHTLRFMPVLEKYVLHQFLPWLLSVLKRTGAIIRAYVILIYTRISHWIAEKWAAFQERRQNRWEYEDEEDENENESDILEPKETKEANEKRTKERENVPLSGATRLEKNKPTVATDFDTDDLPASRPKSPKSPKSSKPINTLEDGVALNVIVDELSNGDNSVDSIDNVVPMPTKKVLLANPQYLSMPAHLPVVQEKALIDWLKSGFSTLGHSIQVRAIHPGPVLVGFEIEFDSEFTAKELNTFIPDLTEALSVNRLKMIEIAPNHFALELPNPDRQIIPLAQLFNSPLWQQASVATLVIGQNSVGETVLLELNRVPHLIIAGVDAEECHTFLDTILLSLLVKNTPEYLRLVLFSGEKKHLSHYHDIPHLLVPLIETVPNLLLILQWCVKEMERRYRLMAKRNVRNIERYNEEWLQQQANMDIDALADTEEEDTFLPYLVIVIPEISELTLSQMVQPIEEAINQLTQKAKAAGLHLLMATQFPSVNVITGLLKTNIPTRIALKVSNKTESRTILGQLGAECLLGQGDMFYLSPGTGMPVRLHGAYVSRQETEQVLNDLRERAGDPHYFSIPLAE